MALRACIENTAAAVLTCRSPVIPTDGDCRRVRIFKMGEKPCAASKKRKKLAD
jgi:hypothetical protein